MFFLPQSARAKLSIPAESWVRLRQRVVFEHEGVSCLEGKGRTSRIAARHGENAEVTVETVDEHRRGISSFVRTSEVAVTAQSGAVFLFVVQLGAGNVSFGMLCIFIDACSTFFRLSRRCQSPAASTALWQESSASLVTVTVLSPGANCAMPRSISSSTRRPSSLAMCSGAWGCMDLHLATFRRCSWTSCASLTTFLL